MPLIYNKALNLTEKEIRYAMANTKSNAQAARFLGCSFTTYKKYSKMYIDEESGKSLFDLHKNQFGIGISRVKKDTLSYPVKTDIFEILEGKHPNYNPITLAKRLITELIVPEECNECGFNERRITDYKVPLILAYKDYDKKNHQRDNIEFLCFNCYSLQYGDPCRTGAVKNF